ncbi:hypothetical protein [Neisseria cinerea]|uniref:hypothetical protein n=1 Tax=Neisseria cinerea TaxID=483 RepID=UPI00131E82EB|nr:hypothetical protein [Neisseria cinerea]
MPKFVTPDPNDRSPNNPSIIVEANQVLGLYNQANGTDRTRVVESVKTWFENKMHDEGWTKVHFSGNQCLLSVEISPIPRANSSDNGTDE